MDKKWLVQIDFWDHSSGNGKNVGLVACTVWGVLFEESERAYHVCPWRGDGDFKSENSDAYAIEKHAVIHLEHIRVIHPSPALDDVA